MSASNIIGIPADDKSFEENCVILFAALLSDPNVKLVGTRGKAQSGLDITGRRDRDPNQPVGIQCKLITRRAKLTEKIIRDETEQALRVKPHLTEYIIVTTARDDPLYDEIATTISQEQATLGRKIDVQVWGWDTLEPKIRADKAALDAFDPGHSASTDRIIELGEESLQNQGQLQGTSDYMIALQEQTLAKIAAIAPDTGKSDALDAHLDTQIDGYRDILNSGKPKTALELLEKLQGKLTKDHSKAIRARVCANIGLAQQRLGDEKAAGELLLKAYEINPDDPKVATNRILGLQLLGRFEESVEWAKTRMEDDPTDEFAAGFMFQAATLMDDPPDPYQLVPADLLTNSTVRLYCCNFLRSVGRIKEWQDLAIQTWEDDPDDTGAARTAAEALLEKAIGDGEFERSPRLTSDRLGYLKQAQELLQKSWDEARGFENADQSIYLVVGCNLVTTYRALKDYKNAERIGNEMLAVNPDDTEVRAACVQIASDQNNPQKALELVRPLADGPEKTSMILHIWSAIPDWQAILDYASEDRRSELSEKLKEQYDTMLFRAKHAHDETLDPALEVANLLRRWPESIAIHVAIADVYRHSDREKFEDVFENARTLLNGKINFGHRAMFAHLSYLEERWDAVIEALDGYVAIDVETEPLAWLALAFANADPRSRSSQFFKSLAPELMASSRYARLAGAAEHGRGDVKAAERYLRAAIADDPTDLRAHLLLQSALERGNQSDKASLHICGLDEAKMVGHPLDKLRLAQLLRRFGATERALRLGFEVASTNRDDGEIVSSYPGLIFADDKMPSHIGSAGPAKEGFWFRLAGQEGEKDVEGILSDEAINGISNFASNHALAVALQGKNVDDELTLPQNMGPDLKYKVAELKHKYIWLLHDIMATHGSRFPEENTMFSMTMKDGDTKPVLDMVKDMDERGRSIIDMYLESPLPLCAIAPMCRKKVVAMADHLAIIGEDVRTCVGLQDERLEAEKHTTYERGNGAVLDTLTVWRAHRLGLLASIKEWFGNLYIPQSVFDELLEMRAEAEFNSKRDFMTIGYNDDGQAFRTMHSVKDGKADVAMIDAAISDVQDHCTAMPVDKADDLDLGSQIADFDASLLIDPVLLARSENCLLLSDELNVRQFAAQYGVQKSAWLQTVAKTLAANEEIPVNQYYMSVARLAVSRHGHISLDAPTLIGILVHDHEYAFEYFQAATRYIGGPKAEMISHIETVKNFMLLVFHANLPDWQKGRAMGLLLNRLIKARSDWLAVLHILEGQLRELTRHSYAAERAWLYMIDWLRGHFIDLALVRADPLAKPKKKHGKSKKQK